jgi:hypothetical protein
MECHLVTIPDNTDVMRLVGWLREIGIVGEPSDITLAITHMSQIRTNYPDQECRGKTSRRSIGT